MQLCLLCSLGGHCIDPPACKSAGHQDDTGLDGSLLFFRANCVQPSSSDNSRCPDNLGSPCVKGCSNFSRKLIANCVSGIPFPR